MENEKYLKTTNAVYELVDLFPDEDPLKNRTKEKTLAILDDLISVNFLTGPEKEKIALQTINDIEMLLGCLSLANCRGFLTKLNLIIIAEEYNKIIQEIKPIADAYKQNVSLFRNEPVVAQPRVAGPERKWNKISELLPVAELVAEAPKKETPQKAVLVPAAPAPRQPRENNSSRQEKIIKILQERGKAQVADFKQVMPDVTKRTLRRDIDDLLKREKINRVGEWNQTFYQIRTS
jgi:hypothetical protein